MPVTANGDKTTLRTPLQGLQFAVRTRAYSLAINILRAASYTRHEIKQPSPNK